MILETVTAQITPSGLFVMGALHEGAGTLVLLGADRGCWPNFKRAREYRDGRPDPLDRWSKRIIGAVARETGAKDTYPSDGPPYAPFISWAMQTGRFFQSPTGMMVHDTAGLMISIRGALHFDTRLDLETPERVNPCDSCFEKPCISACPVGALSATQDYDVPACKSYLDTDPGQDCMTKGCKTRRACPVSIAFERAPEQSAFHMISFKG
ncbi:MAG: ferredoxin [Paracoccaceae bacterium]|nr:ferredoxin [Paracoccaceae bacterium]